MLRYGGLTTCMSIEVEPGHHLLIDAGTGLYRLQAALRDRDETAPQRFSVLLTHFHWDHIQGIPFFQPIFDASQRFTFHAYPPQDMGIEETLDRVMRPPWFPVSFEDAAARREFVHLDQSDETLRFGDVSVRYARLRHPAGVTAYRIDHGDRSIVVATDTERGDPDADARLAELARGADILVHDAQYTPEQYVGTRSGWGHSTWEHAVSAAIEAGVKRLVLTSHDPEHDDDALDAILAAARERFPNTDTAHEGMELPL